MTGAKTKQTTLDILLDPEAAPDKRIEAANELAKTGARDDAAAERMFALLESAEPEIARAASAALRAMKGLGADLVKKAEAEADPAARIRLVRKIAWLKDEGRGGDALASFLARDPEAKVRREAIRGLGMLAPTERTVRALSDALGDGSHQVRALAAGGLAELGRRDAKAKAAVLPKLRASLEREEDEIARDFLKSALRSLGSEV